MRKRMRVRDRKFTYQYIHMQEICMRLKKEFFHTKLINLNSFRIKLHFQVHYSVQHVHSSIVKLL
jgi:hypothetical protein